MTLGPNGIAHSVAYLQMAALSTRPQGHGMAAMRVLPEHHKVDWLWWLLATATGPRMASMCMPAPSTMPEMAPARNTYFSDMAPAAAATAAAAAAARHEVVGSRPGLCQTGCQGAARVLRGRRWIGEGRDRGCVSSGPRRAPVRNSGVGERFKHKLIPLFLLPSLHNQVKSIMLRRQPNICCLCTSCMRTSCAAPPLKCLWQGPGSKKTWLPVRRAFHDVIRFKVQHCNRQRTGSPPPPSATGSTGVHEHDASKRHHQVSSLNSAGAHDHACLVRPSLVQAHQPEEQGA